jgi:hypothetical protein
MNRSKERHTFQAENYIKRCEETGEEPSEDYLDMYKNAKANDLAKEANEQWKENNLEYDLRSTEWICDKAKAREEYAQNIYAALCNQDWQKNEVWPLLKGNTYSCSWRYAGGIVADMREEGDYINWYCSGIKGGASEDELAVMSTKDRERYQWMHKYFVGEGHVTDEVQEDFFKLGWIPVNNNNDYI